MPEFVHIEFPLEWGSVMWRYKLARTEYLHFASSVVASRHVLSCLFQWMSNLKIDSQSYPVTSGSLINDVSDGVMFLGADCWLFSGSWST